MICNRMGRKWPRKRIGKHGHCYISTSKEVTENTAAFSHVSEGTAGGNADVAINCLTNRHTTRFGDSMPSPTMTARRRGLILQPAFRAQTGIAKGEAQQ